MMEKIQNAAKDVSIAISSGLEELFYWLILKDLQYTT